MFGKLKYLLFYSVCIAGVFAQNKDLQKKISLSISNKPLRNVLSDLKNQNGIEFVFGDILVEGKIISFKCENENIEAAIKKMLQKYGISYKIFNSSTYVLYNERKVQIKQTALKPIVIQKKIYDIDSVYSVRKPILVTEKKIIYPEAAVKNNIEGLVTLKFMIDQYGEVVKIKVSGSSGSEILDSASVEFAKTLKFIPAQVNGKPHNIWMSMIYEFRFEK